MIAEGALRVVAESDSGVRRVHGACCALDGAVFAVGGLVFDELRGRCAMSNEVSRWTADCGWERLRLPADKPTPRPRAGHSCCAHEGRVVLFGGHDEAHAKLADVWDLCTFTKWTLYELEVVVEAAMTAEQEAEPAKGKGAAPKGRGAVEETEPLLLFDLATLRAGLEAELELPAEALTLSTPAALPDRPGRVAFRLRIEPLFAVGMRAYGVDGAALPSAALHRLRDKLRAAAVPEDSHQSGHEAAPKDGKGAAAAKKPAAAAKGKAAEPEPAAEERSPPPRIGYPIASWALHETHELAPGQPSWQKRLPAADGADTTTARSGHSADVARGCMYVFGGSSARGVLADLAVLDLATMHWTHAECAGAPPAPRTSHASCALAPSADEPPSLLLICGGIDGKRRLADCCVLDLANKAWCAVEVGAAAAHFPLRASSSTMRALGPLRALVFGGTGAQEEALGELVLLSLEREPAAANKYHVRTAVLGLSAEGTAPPARFGHCSACVPAGADAGAGATTMLVFGGTDANGMLEDCWAVHVAGPRPAEVAPA
jgi:hypothetical protein